MPLVSCFSVSEHKGLACPPEMHFCNYEKRMAPEGYERAWKKCRSKEGSYVYWLRIEVRPKSRDHRDWKCFENEIWFRWFEWFQISDFKNVESDWFLPNCDVFKVCATIAIFFWTNCTSAWQWTVKLECKGHFFACSTDRPKSHLSCSLFMNESSYCFVTHCISFMCQFTR